MKNYDLLRLAPTVCLFTFLPATAVPVVYIGMIGGMIFQENKHPCALYRTLALVLLPVSNELE